MRPGIKCVTPTQPLCSIEPSQHFRPFQNSITIIMAANESADGLFVLFVDVKVPFVGVRISHGSIFQSVRMIGDEFRLAVVASAYPALAHDLANDLPI